MGLLMIVHRVPEGLEHPNMMMNWPAENYPPLGSVASVVQRVNDEILDRGMGTQWFDDTFGFMIPYGVESFGGNVHSGQFRWLMVSHPTPELMDLLVDVGGDAHWRMFNAATGEEVTPGRQAQPAVQQQTGQPPQPVQQHQPVQQNQLAETVDQVVDVDTEGTPEEQDHFARLNEATEAVGQILYHVLPEHAQRLRLDVQVMGDQWMLGFDLDPDGPKPEIPDELVEPLMDLREAMYQQGKGAWFQAWFTVNQAGELDVDYNYDDEPDWIRPPLNFNFIEELNYFPRDPEATPAWLQAAVDAARAEDQASEDPIFPAADSAAPGEDEPVEPEPATPVAQPQTGQPQNEPQTSQPQTGQPQHGQSLYGQPPAAQPAELQQHFHQQPVQPQQPEHVQAGPPAAPQDPAEQFLDVQLPPDWHSDPLNPVKVMWVEQQFVATALAQVERAKIERVQAEHATGEPVRWRVRTPEEQVYLQQLLAENGIAGITITVNAGQEG